MIFDDASTMRCITARCAAVGLASTVCSVVTIGIVRRDSSSRICGAGFAAENSELVLQANDVEPAGIQERRGARIVFDRCHP